MKEGNLLERKEQARACKLSKEELAGPTKKTSGGTARRYKTIHECPSLKQEILPNYP